MLAKHTPVLLNEVLSCLKPRHAEVYCDATFGGGGYTKAVLDSCECSVVAVDQDPVAFAKACEMSQQPEYRGRLHPIYGRFGDIPRLVEEQLQRPFHFDGIMYDIGVSSGQIDLPHRGFSYRFDGPLDMRMCAGDILKEVTTYDTQVVMKAVLEQEELLKHTMTAFEAVNYYSEDLLANIIYQYGGERMSRKIARAIGQARTKDMIRTTAELADVIHRAVPGPRWKRGDDDQLRNASARTFQALRIHVNDELGELQRAIRSTKQLLKPQGRVVAVTFHSLEDRIVKDVLKNDGGQEILESTADSDAQNEWRLVNKKVIRPTEEEVNSNARSRSAKLRAAILVPKKGVAIG